MKFGGLLVIASSLLFLSIVFQRQCYATPLEELNTDQSEVSASRSEISISHSTSSELYTEINTLHVNPNQSIQTISTQLMNQTAKLDMDKTGYLKRQMKSSVANSTLA